MHAHPPIRRFLREPRHVVATLRLLVFGALAVLGWTQAPSAPWLYWSVTVVYGLTVLGYMAAGNGDYRSRRVRVAIFLFDAAVVTALIVLRGRDVQPLVMSYFTVVFLAALLAGVGRPFWNGVLGTVLYTVVMGWGRPPAELLDLSLLGPAFFFFVIAVFMGHVASESLDHGKRRAQAGAMSDALRRSTLRLRGAREGLQAEARLRTVELLCAGIAHEVRRPIAALGQCVRDGRELLEAPEPDAAALDELRGVLADLGHESERLAHVADVLGTLGRGGSAQQAVVPAGALVTGLERLLGPVDGDGVRLTVDAGSEVAVRGDPARLVHLLSILAGNALDAVGPSGGHVHVGTEELPDGGVALTVTDDGPGIAPDVRERMYDPFYTTKGPGRGTGLGLWVAREITHAAGGTLACTTAPGRGTSFRVHLPAAEAAEASEAA